MRGCTCIQCPLLKNDLGNTGRLSSEPNNIGRPSQSATDATNRTNAKVSVSHNISIQRRNLVDLLCTDVLKGQY